MLYIMKGFLVDLSRWGKLIWERDKTTGSKILRELTTILDEATYIRYVYIPCMYT